MGKPWAPNAQGTEIGGALEILKVLVRMNGRREAVSLLFTTSS